MWRAGGGVPSPDTCWAALGWAALRGWVHLLYLGSSQPSSPPAYMIKTDSAFGGENTGERLNWMSVAPKLGVGAQNGLMEVLKGDHGGRDCLNKALQ